MKYLFLITLIILNIGCTKNKNSHDLIQNEKIKLDTDKTITIKIEKSEKDKTILDSIINLETFRAIPLNTKIILAGIDKVNFYKNKFYVLDKQTSNFLIFERDGSFIRKVGERGGGPGEYSRIDDSFLDKENELVLLLSVFDQAIYKFNLNGEFINKTKLNFFVRDFVVLPNGNYLFRSSFSDETKQLLIETNSKGNKVNSYFSFPDDAPKKGIAYSGGLHKQGASIFFTQPTSSIIYQINDIEILSKYKFDFGAGTWAESDKYKIDEFIRSRSSFLNSHLINYYCDTHDVLAFQYNFLDKFGRGYYSKKTEKVYATTQNLDYNYLTGLIDFPVGEVNNQFISYLSFERYSQILHSNNKLSNNLINSPFYNFLKDFKEDEAYLLLYTIDG